MLKQERLESVFKKVKSRRKVSYDKLALDQEVWADAIRRDIG
jgi:DeoR/GlpR family transcriptional regulator of sugar metabolism